MVIALAGLLVIGAVVGGAVGRLGTVHRTSLAPVTGAQSTQAQVQFNSLTMTNSITAFPSTIIFTTVTPLSTETPFSFS